jgi:hypothetical protein
MNINVLYPEDAGNLDTELLKYMGHTLKLPSE